MANRSEVMALEGMEHLQDMLKAAPDALRDHVSKAIARSTVAVSQRMQALVSVREGVLKREIHTSLPRRGGLTGRVLIGPLGFYWRFLEYGTIKMAARPFVRPAAEHESSAFVDNVRDATRELERDWNTGRVV
jgi:HK97 gp10 family phage protein